MVYDYGLVFRMHAPPQETISSPFAITPPCRKPASWDGITETPVPIFDMVGGPGSAPAEMKADDQEARHAMMHGTAKVAVATAAWHCHSACMHFPLEHVLVTCAQAAKRWGQALTSGEGVATIDIGTIDAAQVTWHVNAHAQYAHACVD